MAVAISANIGRDGDGGGGEVAGPILDRETGSTGACGRDRTGQTAAGVYANNGGDGGSVGDRTGQVPVRSFAIKGDGGGSDWWIGGEVGGGLVVVVGWWKKWFYFILDVYMVMQHHVFLGYGFLSATYLNIN